MTRHQLINPHGMPSAIGFSYAVLPAEGRLVHISGITGHNTDMSIPEDYVEQFSAACRRVAKVIIEAGGEPTDLTSMVIYTTDVGEYRDRTKEIGGVYRDVFGKHFPAMALIGIAELADPAARVELVCTAVVPG